jgi:hypothetical protein
METCIYSSQLCTLLGETTTRRKRGQEAEGMLLLGEGDLERMHNNMRADGFDLTKLKYGLLTHAHADRGGNCKQWIECCAKMDLTK